MEVVETIESEGVAACSCWPTNRPRPSMLDAVHPLDPDVLNAPVGRRETAMRLLEILALISVRQVTLSFAH
jgi:hypothetical protein